MKQKIDAILLLFLMIHKNIPIQYNGFMENHYF